MESAGLRPDWEGRESNTDPGEAGDCNHASPVAEAGQASSRDETPDASPTLLDCSRLRDIGDGRDQIALQRNCPLYGREGLWLLGPRHHYGRLQHPR